MVRKAGLCEQRKFILPAGIKSRGVGSGGVQTSAVVQVGRRRFQIVSKTFHFLAESRA